MRLIPPYPRPPKPGRAYYESVYKDCVMVYAEDLAIGDTLRYGGIVQSVVVYRQIGKVQFSLAGKTNNVEISIGSMINLKVS